MKIQELTGAGKMALELQRRIDAAKAALEQGFPTVASYHSVENAEGLAAISEALAHLDTSGLRMEL
jgi:hypothetical protein